MRPNNNKFVKRRSVRLCIRAGELGQQQVRLSTDENISVDKKRD